MKRNLSGTPGTMMTHRQGKTIPAILLLSGILILLLLDACRDRRIITYKNDMGIEPRHLAEIDTPNYTRIEFDDTIRNFGTIKNGKDVVVDYTFRNAGNTVLFISQVKASCGCTIADYPKKAMLPDEKGTITVTFNSKNHPGYIHKTVTVTTNTSNGIRHTLVLEGQVKDSL